MPILYSYHPTLHICVRSDGLVLVPATRGHKAHWTYGCPNKAGYYRICLGGKEYRVHRLVAETFIPNPLNLPEIDHIDRHPSHNSVDNLRWASRSQNVRNSSRHDAVTLRNGTHKYESLTAYNREQKALWRKNNPGREVSSSARYRSTHKRVRCADGIIRWFTNEEAHELLMLPVKDRIFTN